MPTPELRARLFARVAASAAAASIMHTRRHTDAPLQPAAAGVRSAELYAAAPGPARPGEPRRVRLVELAPGVPWVHTSDAGRCEWLVMRGSARVNGHELGEHDFLLGRGGGVQAGAAGALLLLREADQPAAPTLQRAALAPWAGFAPGIRRRVMWQQEGEAAMLYRTEPDAAVPRHAHGHDEECLMLEGDLFLDDVLLRPLDYQLAPAGSGHAGVFTDTGVLLYAHGDAELELRPG